MTTTTTKKKEIVVIRREHDYHVSIKGHPEMWEADKDYQTAIGKLVVSHSSKLGINIILPGEVKKPAARKGFFVNTNVSSLPRGL